MIILGIDPGKKGGLAFYNPYDDTFVYNCPMPLDSAGMVDVLQIQDLIICNQASFAIIEKQQTRGNQRGNMVIGSNYGRLTAVIELCGLKYEEVRPKVWQKKLGLNGDKQNTIDWCIRRGYAVPMTSNNKNARHHDGVADAIAIAVYGNEATE
jgi:Holliday junction resolvasome RuvABC endonuclease subunit